MSTAAGPGPGRRRLLVVDDDVYTHDLFDALIDPGAVDLRHAYDGEEALARCAREAFDAIVTDLRMPRLDGLAFLRALREGDPDTPVVVITAYGSVETAVEAMKLGAFDYLTKPFDKPQTIRLLLARTFEHRDLVRENRALKAQLERLDPAEGIVGTSAAMQAVFRLVERIAPLDSTVLISGESGTGKELIARTLHRLSGRAEQVFLPVNCGALPESLLESTLFGYEKGAFTGAARTTPGVFESASGGTLFLDEVESMTPTLQVRLLRALQERRVYRVGGTEPIEADVRVVSASKVNLKQEVVAGRFRDDLFYRLNVLTVALPPLRERAGDVPALARFFLARFNRRFGRELSGFTDQALAALTRYAWPGNVRELQNVVERAVALAAHSRITAWDLPPEVAPRPAEVPAGGSDEGEDVDDAGEAGWGKAGAPDAEGEATYKVAYARFLRAYLEDLLIRVGGNVSEAARRSGIPRQNLYGKLEKVGIDPGAYRAAGDPGDT